QLLGGAKLRIVRESGDRPVERGLELDEDPRTRCPVMAALAERLEKRATRQLRHEIAGEPADGPEGRGTRARCARAPLVIIAVAHDADAKAHCEGVMQKPFERSPARVHLDASLQPAVVRVF